MPVHFTIIGSDNSLSPGWCQAIIGTKAGILLIETLGTNFSENSPISIQENAFQNVICEMAAIMFQQHCVKSLPYLMGEVTAQLWKSQENDGMEEVVY